MNRINYRDIIRKASRVGNVGALGMPGVLGGYPGLATNQLAMMAGAAQLSPEAWNAYLAAGCNVPCCPVPEPTVARVVFGGFKAKCVKGCSSETLVAHVQAPSQLVGIFFDPSIASSLLISDLRIGRWPALANCEPISAAVFACCDMDDNMFSSINVPANTEICMTVKNRRKNEINLEGVTFKAIICESC